MMEFYYIIHYVIYRYYRKNLESRTMSMCRACGILMLLSFGLIGNIDYFVCLLLETPLYFDKPVTLVYIVLGAIFEYMIFFRNNIYREIFNEYDRLRDEPEMITKCKQAKIFNYSLLVIDIVTLFIIDYINNHK